MAARFGRSRLGLSLAAGAAAATVLVASDDKKRKSRCFAAAAASRETATGEKQQQEKPSGAERSHPTRQVTNEVTGTAAQRAFFAKEMTVMGLPLRASAAVADSALVCRRPRYPRAHRACPCSHQEYSRTHLDRGAVRGGRSDLAHAAGAASDRAGAARAVRGVVSQPSTPAAPSTSAAPTARSRRA